MGAIGGFIAFLVAGIALFIVVGLLTWDRDRKEIT